MSGTPKTSLVERLVQDRLRSGDLEASAAQLLRVGDAAPSESTVRTVPATGPRDDGDVDGLSLALNGTAPVGDAMTRSPAGQSSGTQSFPTEFPADAFPIPDAPAA